MEMNLSSCMALTRALVPQMKARKLGPGDPHFVDHGLRLEGGPQHLLGDQVGADRPGPGQRLDLGKFGITVNCLAPGPFLTDLPGQLLSDGEEGRFAQRTALGRWGDPTSWSARPCCWPATPAATSPARA